MPKLAPDGTTFELSGPPGSPVVVLIHGLGLNRLAWQWHESAMSNRYRVLTYDLLGHGDSAAPTSRPSLSLFSMQLRHLLDHLGTKECAIVGFSLGGMINRRFALDHPDRVRALAILNSPHARSPRAQKEVESRAAQTAEGGPAATIGSTINRWFTTEFQAAEPDTVSLVRQWVLANDTLIYAQCRQVLAHGVTELIRPITPISTPTLVMTAERDSGSTPAMARAIAAEIPGAQTIIVPRLQHLGLIEQPSLYTEPVLKFLHGVQSKS